MNSDTETPTASYEVIGPVMEMVPMRDGVRLATYIWRPGRDGEPIKEPLPIILARTPYGKNWGGDSQFFVSRGYVMAVQDLRHRYDSEGDGDYYHVATPQQGEDGYD